MFVLKQEYVVCTTDFILRMTCSRAPQIIDLAFLNQGWDRQAIDKGYDAEKVKKLAKIAFHKAGDDFMNGSL